LTYHVGMKFTTFDQQHDLCSYCGAGQNCATLYLGAWWYYDCRWSCLNGEYNNTADGSGVYWYTVLEQDGCSSLKVSKMKIRPASF